MAALNLRPGHVYFLTMEGTPDEGVASYYKIGITEGQVRDRIDQLQTGNPFPIAERHSFWSEAAQLIERHLHGRWCTNGVRLEWFRFDPEQVEHAISEGELLNSQISPIAGRVREYDGQASNGRILDPTERMQRLHEQALELLSGVVQRGGEIDLVACELRALTSDSMGIEGVTRVRVTHPDSSFRQALLRERFSNIYEEFLTREKLGCGFQFVGKPRINEFPELRLRIAEARARIRDIAPEALGESTIERRPASEELHDRYLGLRSELTAEEGRLLPIELELRNLCGENEGIAGVCSYRRAISKRLDTRRLHRAHPDIHASCLVQAPANLRFSIVESRGYA